MSEQELYEAFRTAFIASGKSMGEEMKGLSCLYRNWRHQTDVPAEEAQKAA